MHSNYIYVFLQVCSVHYIHITSHIFTCRQIYVLVVCITYGCVQLLRFCFAPTWTWHRSKCCEQRRDRNRAKPGRFGSRDSRRAMCTDWLYDYARFLKWGYPKYPEIIQIDHWGILKWLGDPPFKKPPTEIVFQTLGKMCMYHPNENIIWAIINWDLEILPGDKITKLSNVQNLLEKIRWLLCGKCWVSLLINRDLAEISYRDLLWRSLIDTLHR